MCVHALCWVSARKNHLGRTCHCREGHRNNLCVYGHSGLPNRMLSHRFPNATTTHPLSLGPPGLPERDNGQPVPGKRQATKSNSSANAVQFRPFPHPRVLKPETRKMGPFRACCQPILCRWLEIDLPLIIGMLGEHNRAGLCYVAAVCSVLCSCWGSCSQNYYRI